MFTSETFLQAHRIAFSQFEATRGNIRIFRDATDLVAAAANFVAIDTKALLRQLSYKAADGQHYCVIGEFAAPQQFSMGTLEQTYAVNSRLRLVNTAIGALKGMAKQRRPLARIGRILGRGSTQSPLTADEISALLASQLDEILLGTRALSEAFLHISKVAAQPAVARRIISIAGYDDGSTLSLQDAADADRVLTKLLEQYKQRRMRAASEVLAAALNTDALAPRVGQMHASQIPAWMDKPDENGAKIVNDVWLPADYAERIAGQAQAREVSA